MTSEQGGTPISDGILTDLTGLEIDIVNQSVVLVRGDITQIEADAIVCPTLPDLDNTFIEIVGEIYRASGDSPFAEARSIGVKAAKETSNTPVPSRSAHLTGAGRLPNARYIIHSVAVDIVGEDALTCTSDTVYESAYNALQVADANRLRSVAFTPLAKRIYHLSIQDSLAAIATAAKRFFNEHEETNIKRVVLVVPDQNATVYSPREDFMFALQTAKGRTKQN